MRRRSDVHPLVPVYAFKSMMHHRSALRCACPTQGGSVDLHPSKALAQLCVYVSNGTTLGRHLRLIPNTHTHTHARYLALLHFKPARVHAASAPVSDPHALQTELRRLEQRRREEAGLPPLPSGASTAVAASPSAVSPVRPRAHTSGFSLEGQPAAPMVMGLAGAAGPSGTGWAGRPAGCAAARAVEGCRDEAAGGSCVAGACVGSGRVAGGGGPETGAVSNSVQISARGGAAPGVPTRGEGESEGGGETAVPPAGAVHAGGSLRSSAGEGMAGRGSSGAGAQREGGRRGTKRGVAASGGGAATTSCLQGGGGSGGGGKRARRGGVVGGVAAAGWEGGRSTGATGEGEEEDGEEVAEVEMEEVESLCSSPPTACALGGACEQMLQERRVLQEMAQVRWMRGKWEGAWERGTCALQEMAQARGCKGNGLSVSFLLCLPVSVCVRVCFIRIVLLLLHAQAINPCHNTVPLIHPCNVPLHAHAQRDATLAEIQREAQKAGSPKQNAAPQPHASHSVRPPPLPLAPPASPPPEPLAHVEMTAAVAAAAAAAAAAAGGLRRHQAGGRQSFVRAAASGCGQGQQLHLRRRQQRRREQVQAKGEGRGVVEEEEEEEVGGCRGNGVQARGGCGGVVQGTSGSGRDRDGREEEEEEVEVVEEEVAQQPEVQVAQGVEGGVVRRRGRQGLEEQVQAARQGQSFVTAVDADDSEGGVGAGQGDGPRQVEQHATSAQGAMEGKMGGVQGEEGVQEGGEEEEWEDRPSRQVATGGGAQRQCAVPGAAHTPGAQGGGTLSSAERAAAAVGGSVRPLPPPEVPRLTGACMRHRCRGRHTF